MRKALANNAKLPDKSGDVTCDGKSNVCDLVSLKRRLIGLD
jgi:hypothetical protein